ncbi:MAG: hypothetical protein JXQ69_03680 [Paludibacteraceae bacterium]|nr:hypothetical protein [Paludibacteraceae bacterium]
MKKPQLFTRDYVLPALISILAIIYAIGQITQGRIGVFIFSIVLATVFGLYARNEFKKTL